MTLAGVLLVATMALPLLLAAALGKRAVRDRALDLLVLAPFPGLAAALLVPHGSAALSPMRIVLALDPLGAALLGTASLLWLLAGAYARAQMAGDARAVRFAFWWLLTQAGSLGCFLVADIASFYLTFSLASLAAYWLVVHEGTSRASRAGFVYMALAVLGEAVLLLAFVMMAVGGDGNPLIAEAAARLPGSPHQGVVVALLVVGFGLKMGLVPLHVWMPLAHPVAPVPASAALSGIIVKAGVIGLIRFLPLDTGYLAGGTALTAIGLFTAFYAAIVGITQAKPKTVLAYSTVSQMGFVATILGSGLAVGSTTAASVTAFYALHHLLAKGALFLGYGVVAAGGARVAVLAAMVIPALALAGLPFTGGALAKYAAKEVIDPGAAGTLATLAATGSTVLMLHFLRMLREQPDTGRVAPVGLLVPWAVATVASIAIPYAVMDLLTGMTPLAALTITALWKAAWPILLGVAISASLIAFAARLPAIPEGDIVVVADGVGVHANRFGTALERADTTLRSWPAGVTALLAVALAVALTLRLPA
jgi:formate hydrogenlyase subunit 3/multisubunit Na+/H+ antiporter MnhD subunit